MQQLLDKYILLLIGVCILIFFFNLDAIYINIMEARNFGTAREMLTSGNWLLTTLNDMPRYEKPPLPTWLTAFSAKLFGVEHLWALRLPAASVASLLCICFYRFNLKLHITRKHSFIATLILITSFYIIFSGRNGQWDIFTHAFMMPAIYYLFKIFNEDKLDWRNCLIGGLFFGFSILSKGPVSLYALLLPFIISYGLIYRFRNFQKKWIPLTVFVLVGLVIGLWWFVYVRMVDPVAFLEITTDEASNWGSYNIRPFYYYWSFFVQSGIWTIPALVSLLYPYLKNRVENKKTYQFSILWTLIAVVLLSIIPEKKSRYLLPVLIPLALNTSFYISYLFNHFKQLKNKEKWVVYFNFGLIACLGIVFPIAAPFVLDLSGSDYIWYTLTAISLFGVGCFMIYYLRQNNFPKVFYLTVSFLCFVIVFAFPLVDSLISNPNYREFSALHAKAKEQGLKVYEYNSFTPEIIWDYGEPIPLLIEKQKINLPETATFGMLLYPKDSIDASKFANYSIQKIEQYDLNQVHPDKSGYKDRLVRDFYILKVRQ